MEQSVVRVLQVLHANMDRGGIETMLMNYYRNIDRSKLQFDFLITASHKCDYEDEILAGGGRIYRVPKLTLRAPGYLWKYMTAVDTLLKAHPEYKIVHSHANALGVFFLYVAKKNNIPIRIVHSHTIKGGNPIRSLVVSTLKLFSRKVGTHFFACSMDAAEWLHGKKFTRANKVIILKNAIETSLYAYNENKRVHIRAERGWTDKFVIGHVGRLSYPKNHGFILDIFKEVKKVHPDSILLLIGHGVNRNYIEKRITTEGLEGSVILEGVVENVFDYMQIMDIFLFPSHYEGLGIVLIEAQAAGLPCFTSDGVVPREAAITNLVEYIPLSKGPKYWAEQLLKYKDGGGYERRNTYREVVQASYDIKLNAAWLQNYYIESFHKLSMER